MKGLVLCGGRGTRLRPLTYTFAKQLIPVANRPILSYVFDHLAAARIKEVGVIISPETGPAVQEFLGDGANWNTKICYILQNEPLGLAHAVKIAREFLGDEPFVMYLGDNLLQDGITSALNTFFAENVDALIMLKPVQNPSAFGVAVLSEKGDIVRLVEKPKNPPSNLALVGVYLFSPKIHSVIETLRPSARNELEITDAIQALIEQGARVKPIMIEGWWLDTGKKDDLLDANHIVLNTYCPRAIAGTVAQSELIGNVSIAPDAKIVDSKIYGPTVIGAGAVVETSTIGPYASIGNNCTIRNSHIEGSVVLEKSTIIGVNRITRSLIGRQVKVRANPEKEHDLRLLLSDSSEVEL
ncbi:MAG: glucose-1-phosphate thymidylyltransferase [candidate division WOR-3 bacterium]|jgi:glucose-1-phosphate thymidylyltransferase|nr:glucose-1-phosphate thymidylyltransferase [candidate division WOR-3 bacterium]MCR4424111.1 glucose-1-phosphate thymidylyltransferase [candidate division WOR-3 bacterium]MDH7519470.1 glucose-1-phosphate thymidylyltransferase [bacterium]